MQAAVAAVVCERQRELVSFTPRFSLLSLSPGRWHGVGLDPPLACSGTTGLASLAPCREHQIPAAGQLRGVGA